jgi:FlaA1/EpsC-like NDP-sugar epimerase
MLKDKIVIVTGGCGLLGQEFVKTIMENKGVAVIADINGRKGRK